MKRSIFTALCLSLSLFAVGCFGGGSGSSPLDGKWLFSQGIIEFNSKRGRFKQSHPYMDSQVDGKFKQYEATLITLSTGGGEELYGIFRTDGSLLLNIAGKPSEFSSYRDFWGGEGSNAQSLGGTWTYTNKKGGTVSFIFDKEKGTFEFVSGGDSTQGTYIAEPLVMLDMNLYADDFDSDGYEILLPVKFLDENTFTTPDGEIYKKAGR